MARIDHYEFGRIVVNGREETRDLIIVPDRVVRNWWRQHGHALVLDDLGEVLDELPTHLIVGTGANGRMRPDPDTIHQLQERGVTVETLPTTGLGSWSGRWSWVGWLLVCYLVRVQPQGPSWPRPSATSTITSEERHLGARQRSAWPPGRRAAGR